MGEMTPIEAMAKAAWDDLQPPWEKVDEVVKKTVMDEMRRAARALAGQFNDPVVKYAILWAAKKGASE